MEHSYQQGLATISIHALREEGDLVAVIRPGLLVAISIHALREEGDQGQLSAGLADSLYFYPRPPRGGRQLVCYLFRFHAVFLSTPSARRATVLRMSSTVHR